MKKITRIYINDIPFYFEEDAAEMLEKYIERIKELYKDNGEELKVTEVETRIADICNSKAGNAGIITSATIQEAINTIGIKIETPRQEEPETSTEEKCSKNETCSNDSDEPWHKAMLLGNKLFRNTHDRVIGGIISGLAAYFGLSTGWLRLLTFLLFLIEPIGSLIFIAYIILWIITPKAITIIDYTRMYRVAAGNDIESIKNEWKNNYDRCTQELALPSDSGCLRILARFLFFILVSLLAVPFAIFFIITITFITIFITIGGELLSITGSHVHFIAGISSVVFIGILLFVIMHWIFKKLKKCKPMNKWAKVTIIILLIITMIVSFLSIGHILKENGGYTGIKNTLIQDIDSLKNNLKASIYKVNHRSGAGYYFHNPLETDDDGRTIGIIWDKELQECNIPMTIESIHNDKGECKILFYAPSDTYKEKIKKIIDKDCSARYNIVIPEETTINGTVHFMWDSCKNTLLIDEDYNLNGTISSGIINNSPEDFEIIYSDDISYDNAAEKGLIPFKIVYTQKLPELFIDDLFINTEHFTIINN